jgi:fructose-1,6-bisphosphatase/inositol monophosphatase family enzyme
MITADKDAELAFERFIDTYNNGHFKDIDFYGEETLGNQTIDLTGKDGTCVLVDALDGSDLYERNLGNWCTAATFFTPNARPGRRLRAAVAGLPDGSIYYAIDTSRSIEVLRKPKSPPEKVRGMSAIRSAETASICFYGQKVGNFLAGAESALWPPLFARDAVERKEKGKALRLRIYNLAGIPMILKMVDKVAKNGAGIDAVVDFKGQKAHDIVPGAFLALKAGAEVVEPDGTPITIRRLEEFLLRPNSESLRYVIAVSKELKDNIVKLNRPTRMAKGRPR